MDFHPPGMEDGSVKQNIWNFNREAAEACLHNILIQLLVVIITATDNETWKKRAEEMQPYAVANNSVGVIILQSVSDTSVLNP